MFGFFGSQGEGNVTLSGILIFNQSKLREILLR